jgi:hypothetical protein
VIGTRVYEEPVISGAIGDKEAAGGGNQTCAAADGRLVSFPADGKSREGRNCALERQSVDGTSRGA